MSAPQIRRARASSRSKWHSTDFVSKCRILSSGRGPCVVHHTCVGGRWGRPVRTARMLPDRGSSLDETRRTPCSFHVPRNIFPITRIPNVGNTELGPKSPCRVLLLNRQYEMISDKPGPETEEGRNRSRVNAVRYCLDGLVFSARSLLKNDRPRPLPLVTAL